MGNQRLTQTQATEQKSQPKSGMKMGRKPHEDALEHLQGLGSNRAVNGATLAVTAKPRGQHEPDIQSRHGSQVTKPSFRGLSQEITGGSQPQALVIQRKLVIGQPNDQYEQEADRVAQQVVQQLNAPKLAQSSPVQTIQRGVMPDEEEDKLQMKPMLQSQAGAGEVAATSELESSIQQMRGSGQPLPDSIREPMERSFGADFSKVRIHEDAKSDQLNRSIQAKAFTTGQDVFFRQGAYEPGSCNGQELIVHELTHIVQQNNTEQDSVKSQNGNSIKSLPTRLPSGLTRSVNVIQRGKDDDDDLFLTPLLVNARKGLRETPPKKLERQEKVGNNLIEKRYEEIENQKTKTYKDLDAIAQQSKYKHLRKVGKNNDDDTYKTEYKKADIGKTQGVFKPKLEALVASIGELKVWEEELTLLQQMPVKASTRKAQLEALEDKKKKIDTLKNTIAAQEAFLRVQKAPINWKDLTMDESKMTDRKVDYLTKPEREDFALRIESGKFKHKAKGNKNAAFKPYDTKTSYTVDKGKGWGIYVMDPNGKFYAGPHTIGRFHHSSFLAGGAVAGAGELKVDEGTLKGINNKSGHYTPGIHQVVQTLAQLKQEGVDLTNVGLQVREGTHIADKFLEDNKLILGSSDASSKEDTPERKDQASLRELGVYNMNGEWRTESFLVDEAELKTYKDIAENGGSQALRDKGFRLDEEGSWRDESGKPVSSAEFLLKRLIGETDSESESEEIDEDEKYSDIVDEMVGEKDETERSINRDKIKELLKDEFPNLIWDDQWLQDGEPVEKADIGRALEKYDR